MDICEYLGTNLLGTFIFQPAVGISQEEQLYRGKTGNFFPFFIFLGLFECIQPQQDPTQIRDIFPKGCLAVDFKGIDGDITTKLRVSTAARLAKFMESWTVHHPFKLPDPSYSLP